MPLRPRLKPHPNRLPHTLEPKRTARKSTGAPAAGIMSGVTTRPRRAIVTAEAIATMTGICAGNSIRDDGLATLKCRTNHIVDQLGSRGHEQQHLAAEPDRVHGPAQ